MTSTKHTFPAGTIKAGETYHLTATGTLPMASEGTDLYGTRAIPQNGQPVHDRCGQPLRWSVAYDEPHWVHTSAAAVMACPPVRGAL